LQDDRRAPKLSR
jgi:hypothetical protein